MRGVRSRQIGPQTCRWLRSLGVDLQLEDLRRSVSEPISAGEELPVRPRFPCLGCGLNLACVRGKIATAGTSSDSIEESTLSGFVLRGHPSDCPIPGRVSTEPIGRSVPQSQPSVTLTRGMHRTMDSGKVMVRRSP